MKSITKLKRDEVIEQYLELKGKYLKLKEIIKKINYLSCNVNEMNVGKIKIPTPKERAVAKATSLKIKRK